MLFRQQIEHGWGLAALLLVILSACDRPFVEVSQPGVTFVEPDLSSVLVDSRVAIGVTAHSFRPIQEVTLNGLPMTFNAPRERWEITFDLRRGLNTLVVEALDSEDVVGVDTTYAVHMPYRFIQNAPNFRQARGGHTATMLRDGSVFVVGGAAHVEGPAQGDAFLLQPNARSFFTLQDTLNAARTGHSATRLPDGRVLILGGSRSDAVTLITHLIETVEIFDPTTQAFHVIPFEGQPIRRTLHTAVLRNTTSGVFIDLYGGRGDIRYGGDPRLGTRRDLRTFELAHDTLFALTTLLSAPYLEAAISGHTETAVRTGTYLVFGNFFDNQLADEASFRIDYNSPPDLLITDAPPLLTPRTLHAAATLSGRFVVVFGGRQASPLDVLNETELFSDQAGLLFRLPGISPSIKRFGQTATNVSANRILLLGGFDANGNSVSASEFFDASLNN